MPPLDDPERPTQTVNGLGVQDGASPSRGQEREQGRHGQSAHFPPFLAAALDILFAALLIVGHAAVVLVFIYCGGMVERALGEAYQGHEPEMAGVTLRFLLHGGEFLLIITVLALGLASTAIFLSIAMLLNLRSQWRRLK